MQAQSEIHNQIEAVLTRLSALVSGQDLRVLSEFAPDALLVGSEDGEVAEGKEELKSFFQRIFAQPIHISWEWQRLRASSARNMAWFFAEGYVVLTSAATEKRVPYRLAGVLQWQDDRWLWRQFNGSEPAKA
jgi:uncharacterized protein (TIGR02246 family)